MTQTPHYTFSRKHMNAQRKQEPPYSLIFVAIILILMMIDDMTSAIPFLATALCCAAIYVLLYYQQIKHLEQLFREGIFITGEVTSLDLKKRYRRSPRAILHYEYPIQGQTYQSWSRIPLQWLQTNGRVGDYIDLVVNPDNLNDATIAELYGIPIEKDGLIAAKLIPMDNAHNDNQE